METARQYRAKKKPPADAGGFLKNRNCLIAYGFFTVTSVPLLLPSTS